MVTTATLDGVAMPATPDEFVVVVAVVPVAFVVVPLQPVMTQANELINSNETNFFMLNLRMVGD